jgi:hypothetical protein
MNLQYSQLGHPPPLARFGLTRTKAPVKTMHLVETTGHKYQFKVHTTMENACFVCIDLDVDTQGGYWQRRQPGLGYQRIVNYIDLRKTATRDCKLCSIIFEGIEAFRYALGNIGEETEVFLHCNPPLFPLVIGIAENKWAAARWLEFFTLASKYTKGGISTFRQMSPLLTFSRRPARSMARFWTSKLGTRKTGR